MRSTVKHLGLLVATAMVAVLLVMSTSGITARVATASDVRQIRADAQGVAAVNQVISFQGRLLDPATGQPKADGIYGLTFQLYNSATGGTALWTELRNVTVTRGLFTTLLGVVSSLPPTLFDGQTLYLGIAVEEEAEATPRQQLGYGAYSFYALNAGALGGQSASAFAQAAHTHTGSTIDDGSITADDLAPTLPKVKFINLDLFGALLTGSARNQIGSGPEPGIRLLDSTESAFYLNFTLPPDYTPGGDVWVDILWHTSATNCNVVFTPNAMSVARRGRTHITGPTPESGITVVGGTQLQAPATSNESSLVVVDLAAPDGVTALQPYDAITFSLYRHGAAVNDTCAADQMLQGFLVRYE